MSLSGDLPPGSPWATALLMSHRQRQGAGRVSTTPQTVEAIHAGHVIDPGLRQGC